MLAEWQEEQSWLGLALRQWQWIDPYDFQQYIDTTNNKTLYFLYAYHVPGTEKGHYSTLFTYSLQPCERDIVLF